MNKLLTFSLLCMISAVACKTDNAEELYPEEVLCDTVNIKYASTVQPVLQTNCLNQGCHTAGNPSGGYKFDNYNNFKLVITNDKLINSIKYTTGGLKNMPPTGKLNNCNINKIEAWIKSGFPNN